MSEYFTGIKHPYMASAFGHLSIPLETETASIITSDTADTENFITFVNATPDGTAQSLKGNTSLKYNALTGSLTISGPVGIGVTGPSFSLSLGGDVARTIGMNESSSSIAPSLTLKGADAVSGVNTQGGPLYLSAGLGTGNATTSNIIFSTGTATGPSGATRQTLTEKMRITSNGSLQMTTGDGILINPGSQAASLAITRAGTFTANVREINPPYTDNVGTLPSGGGAQISLLKNEMTFSTYPSTAVLGGPIILTERMRITSTGVGIGTSGPTGPSFSLTFGGDVARTIGMNESTLGVAPSLTLKGADAVSGVNTQGGPLYLSAGLGTGNATTSNIIFSTATPLSSGGTRQTLTERMRITSTGVGIGTTTPTEALDIAGSLNLFSTEGRILNNRYDDNTGGPSYLYLRRAYGTPTGPAIISSANQGLAAIYMEGWNGSGFVGGARIDAYIDGITPTSTSMPTKLAFYTTPNGSTTQVERMVIKNDGKVGIGTSGPIGPSFSLSLGGDVARTIGMNESTLGVAPSLTLKGADAVSGVNTQGGPLYLSAGLGTGDTTTSNIIFSTGTSGPSGATRQTLTEKMRITSNGNVGIGTSAPALNLDVANGSIGNSTGDLTLNVNSTGAGGSLNLAGGTGLLADTAGATSTKHLVLSINGTIYKIKLENAS